MKKVIAIVPVLAALLITGCVDEKDTEELQPMVEILSPFPCDTIYFDAPFTFMLRITDPSGSGLGSLSFDAHNNFNHHSHGSHESCRMDPKRDAENPWDGVWIHTLPANKNEYVFETEITIPLKDENEQYHDHGDYHFHIYVTNNEGYQTFISLDFKLLRP
jgi:hypothetical protein